MAKELRCGDLMAGCDFVARGKDEDEVLKAAAQHAKTAHDLNEITPDLEKKVRGAIRDAGAMKDADGKDFTLGTSRLG